MIQLDEASLAGDYLTLGWVRKANNAGAGAIPAPHHLHGERDG